MINKGIKAVTIFFIIIIITGASIFEIKKYNIYRNEENRLKNIAITKDAIKLYINTADEVGKNKIQLNWKEIAAVSAVEENNYFARMDQDKVKALAENFIVVKTIAGKEYFGSKSVDKITD
ncbi:MAG: hypothetical protein ABRQ27_10580, partial [Clostridiaceae bacterium]